MGELVNRTNGVNGINYPQIPAKVTEQASSEQNEGTKSETDLRNMPAGVGGRSQVSNSNTLKHDMENFDPKIAEKIMNMATFITHINKNVSYPEALDLVLRIIYEFPNRFML